MTLIELKQLEAKCSKDLMTIEKPLKKLKIPTRAVDSNREFAKLLGL